MKSNSSNCDDFIANGLQFTRSQSTGLSWGQWWILSKASIEAKRIPEFKDGLQLIWSTLTEKKPLYKAVRLSQATAGMCVSQR